MGAPRTRGAVTITGEKKEMKKRVGRGETAPLGGGRISK